MQRKNSPKTIWRHALVFCLSLTLTGCGGSSDQPELGQVSGTVTLDGEPLAEAVVFFWPAEGGRTAMAETDENGDYELQYNSDSPGTKVGSNQVRVTKEVIIEGSETGEVRELIPERYNEKSELTFEVQAGSNRFDIELQSE